MSRTTEVEPLSKVVRVIHQPKFYAAKKVEPFQHEEALDLSFGVSPFGYPPEYDDIEANIKQKLYEVNKGDYESVDSSIGIQHVRALHNLSEDPYVVFDNGGSDSIIERIFGRFAFAESQQMGRIRIITTEPQYPHVGNALWPYLIRNRQGEFALNQRISYEVINGDTPDAPLETTLKNLVEQKGLFAKRNPQECVFFYLSNPNTPTGDVVSLETIKSLAEIFEEAGIKFVIDQAFGAGLPSAAYLANVYKHIITLDTLSKIIGLPILKTGYAVMSKGIGERFQKVQRVCDLNPRVQLIVNEILRPDIINKFLQDILPQIQEVKTELVSQLDEAGIKHPPTDNRTLTVYLNGDRPSFHGNLMNLGMKTAHGGAFNQLHFQEPFIYSSGNNSSLDGMNCVRLTIPREKAIIPDIIGRLKRAIGEY